MHLVQLRGRVSGDLAITGKVIILGRLCEEEWDDYVPNPNYKPADFEGMRHRYV